MTRSWQTRKVQLQQPFVIVASRAGLVLQTAQSLANSTKPRRHHRASLPCFFVSMYPACSSVTISSSRGTHGNVQAASRHLSMFEKCLDCIACVLLYKPVQLNAVSLPVADWIARVQSTLQSRFGLTVAPLLCPAKRYTSPLKSEVGCKGCWATLQQSKTTLH